MTLKEELRIVYERLAEEIRVADEDRAALAKLAKEWHERAVAAEAERDRWLARLTVLEARLAAVRAIVK